MGKVHKKKLAEYAENEELNKSGSSNIADDESPEKSATGAAVEGAENITSESEDEANSGVAVAKTSDADEEEDEKSVHDDAEDAAAVQPEKNGKKSHKRKASEKKSVVAAERDSEDEPLNGDEETLPKRGRKAPAKVTKEAPAPKSKAAAGRGRAKPPAKKVVAEEAKKVVAEESKKVVSEEEEENDEGDEDDEEEEEEYEVKEIIDHKTERGVSLFLIRWKGYTKADDTWEPEDSLTCPDLIEKYKKKHEEVKPKKSTAPAKKAASSAPASSAAASSGSRGSGGRSSGGSSSAAKQDPNKEWEVEKIIDYAEEKNGRVFRIRWKGFGPKYDTWEPEKNLYCEDIIKKFMSRMKLNENVSFKELREEPKKPKRLYNQVAPRTNYHNPIGRKSKRGGPKERVYYGDSDE